jgi:galactarate dehydratase
VALVDVPAGAPVRRYNVVIGHAVRDLPAGSWVHERVLHMPDACGLDDLPKATAPAPDWAALSGYTFEGYRNADGSVGTRNILAITTTVQCVSGVVEFAVQRIRQELLPLFPHVDDVVGLSHSYGCGVAIDAPDAVIPIRTLRHISLNPNFGGEVMVVSLGCEKLQPDRLLPPGSIPLVDARSSTDNSVLDVVCLQDEGHVGFMSMIDSILRQARVHLERLNLQRRVFGRDRQPSGGLCHRFAGARWCRGDVLRGDRGARRYRPVDRPCRHPRRGRRHDPRDGLVRRVFAARLGRPQRQHHTGQ